MKRWVVYAESWPRGFKQELTLLGTFRFRFVAAATAWICVKRNPWTTAYVGELLPNSIAQPPAKLPKMQVVS